MSTQNHDERLAESGRAALATLAEADRDRVASGRVDAALMAAFDARHPAVHADWRRWMAIAAVLVLAVGAALAWLALQPPDLAGQDEPLAAAARANEAGPAGESTATAFVPWPGATVLPAFEGGELVRTTLPAAVLPLLGFPQTDAPADGRIVADVLIGQDGYPRAVRVVSSKALRP